MAVATRHSVSAGINKVMKNKNASPALVPLWPPLVLLAPECSSYIFGNCSGLSQM